MLAVLLLSLALQGTDSAKCRCDARPSHAVQVPQYRARPTKHGNTDQKPAAPAPAVVHIIDSLSADTKAEREQAEHLHETRERQLVIATALTAAFTAALVIVTGLLWRAAFATLRSSERYARIQSRAYLSVKGINGFYQDRVKGYYFGGNPDLLNSGRTPAYKVSYWANCAVLPHPLPATATLDPPAQIVTHEAVLGIGDGFSLGTFIDHYVDDSEVDAIMKGTGPKALYVWGCVTYEDAFGKPHWTEFCHHTFFPVGADGKVKVRVNYVEGRNKADRPDVPKKRKWFRN